MISHITMVYRTYQRSCFQVAMQVWKFFLDEMEVIWFMTKGFTRWYRYDTSVDVWIIAFLGRIFQCGCIHTKHNHGTTISKQTRIKVWKQKCSMPSWVYWLCKKTVTLDMMDKTKKSLDIEYEKSSTLPKLNPTRITLQTKINLPKAFTVKLNFTPIPNSSGKRMRIHSSELDSQMVHTLCSCYFVSSHMESHNSIPSGNLEHLYYLTLTCVVPEEKVSSKFRRQPFSLQD